MPVASSVLTEPGPDGEYVAVDPRTGERLPGVGVRPGGEFNGLTIRVSAAAKEVFDALTRIVPPLFKLGRDLYELHKGNTDAVIARIEDYRADVKAKRAETDAMLEKKYESKE